MTKPQLLSKFIAGSIFVVVISTLTLAMTSAGARNETLTISAAASLRGTVDKIAEEFEEQNEGVRVRVNFAGSNLLARQIEAGAPADVFISADERTMDRLHEKKLIDAESRFDLLGNTLVAVVPAGSDLKIEQPGDLAARDLRRIAVCERAVPAGHYAEAMLRHFNLLDQLQGRFVRMEDVRAALAAVQNAHADLGFVYRTDAATTPKVRVAWEAPAESHEPIVYPAAIVAATKQPKLAAEFMKYVGSQEARQIFTGAGFDFLPARDE